VDRVSDNKVQIYSVGPADENTPDTDRDPLPVKLRVPSPVSLADSPAADKRTKVSARFKLTEADTSGFTPLKEGSGFRFSPVKETKSGKTVLVSPKELPWKYYESEEKKGTFAFDDAGLTMTLPFGTAKNAETEKEYLIPNTLYYLTAFFTYDGKELFLKPATANETLECESAIAEFSTLPDIKSGGIVRTPDTPGGFKVSAGFFSWTPADFVSFYGSAISGKTTLDIKSVRIYCDTDDIAVKERPEGGPHPPADTETLATNAGGDCVDGETSENAVPVNLKSKADYPTAYDFDNAGIKGDYYSLNTQSVRPGASRFVLEITNARGDTDILELRLTVNLEVTVPVKMIFAAFEGEKNPVTGLTPIRSPLYTIRAKARSPVKVTLTEFLERDDGAIPAEAVPGAELVPWGDDTLTDHAFNLNIVGQSPFRTLRISKGTQTDGFLGTLGEGIHLGSGEEPFVKAGTFRLEGRYKGPFSDAGQFLIYDAVFKFELANQTS
jgi:hypothetical protein